MDWSKRMTYLGVLVRLGLVRDQPLLSLQVFVHGLAGTKCVASLSGYQITAVPIPWDIVLPLCDIDLFKLSPPNQHRQTYPGTI